MGKPVALEAKAEEREVGIDFYNYDAPSFGIVGKLDVGSPTTSIASTMA